MIQVGVIGAGQCSQEIERMAEEVGKEIARKGAILICGGLGGVMEAAARGAKAEGGLAVGILPGPSKDGMNPFIDVAVATAMGHGRNVVIAHSADALIAVGGGYGTLSEIAIGMKLNKRVVGLRSWDIQGIINAEQPGEAVDLALAC